MIKSIRWQIQFVSRKGTHYRIDIYDEVGSWSGITTLLAGETPLKTDEDNNNDFFTPIRSQTGNIEVCTAIPVQTNYPNGGQLDLNDILPANNIARPVQLINLDNSNAIEWQGFLSCEMYSQAYTSISENIQLAIISTLEAMDSVEVELSENMAFKKILGHIAYAMKSIETQSGMTLFRNVYLSQYIRSVLTDKFLYNNCYFKSEESISGDNIVVEVHSISCKEILEQIAKFFGCCWRENGQDIYLEAIGKTNAFDWQTFANIASDYIDGTSFITSWNTLNQTLGTLFSLEWAGTNHTRNMAQGMRRVKIAAKLGDFNCKMNLEECPVNDLVENPTARQSENGEVYVNTNENFYNLAEHKHYLTKAIFPRDLSGASLQLVSTLPGINYNHTIFWETDGFRQYYKECVVDQTGAQSAGFNHYITSFMAWWRDKQGYLQSGLMICGVPKNLIWSHTPVQDRPWNKYALTSDNYLFRQRTPLIFAASKGFLRININTLAWSNAEGTMPSIVYGYFTPTLTIALQFGNKWAYNDNGTYRWSDSFQTIDFPLEKRTTDGELGTAGNWDDSMGVPQSNGIFISLLPVLMTGFVSIYVYPYINGICADPYTSGMFDVFITKMDIDYVVPSEELRTDRGENVYTAETSQAFKEELSINCDIASYANNTKLATMVWNNSDTPARLLSLGDVNIRPEVDLLNRLKTYYTVARQRLELEAEHITDHALATLRLQGLGDNKVYLPLYESRDWQTDVCKLTCFEMPQEPSES